MGINWRRTAGVMTLTVVGLGSPIAGAGKPGAADTPLVVSVRDDTGDGVRSDTYGSVYRNGEMNVKAVLVGNSAGNFVFDTNTGTSGGRRIRLDFGTQPVPFATSSFDIDAYLGTLEGGTADFGDLRALKSGESLTRRGPISWTDGSRQWALRWNGESTTDGRILGLLTFYCSMDDGRACTAWEVTPTNPLAVLDSVPTKGPSTRTVYGYYTMPFQLHLQKK